MVAYGDGVPAEMMVICMSGRYSAQARTLGTQVQHEKGGRRTSMAISSTNCAVHICDAAETATSLRGRVSLESSVDGREANAPKRD